jgi:hypothetical protein
MQANATITAQTPCERNRIMPFMPTPACPPWTPSTRPPPLAFLQASADWVYEPKPLLYRGEHVCGFCGTWGRYHLGMDILRSLAFWYWTSNVSKRLSTAMSPLYNRIDMGESEKSRTRCGEPSWTCRCKLVFKDRFAGTDGHTDYVENLYITYSG